jgi:hypothetical protein
VVRQASSNSVPFVQAWAIKHLPAADRQRFVELVQTELDSLHAGNFARYRIRPSEFTAWQEKKDGHG